MIKQKTNKKIARRNTKKAIAFAEMFLLIGMSFAIAFFMTTEVTI